MYVPTYIANADERHALCFSLWQHFTLSTLTHLHSSFRGNVNFQTDWRDHFRADMLSTLVIFWCWHCTPLGSTACHPYFASCGSCSWYEMTTRSVATKVQLGIDVSYISLIVLQYVSCYWSGCIIPALHHAVWMGIDPAYRGRSEQTIQNECQLGGLSIFMHFFTALKNQSKK